MRLEYKSNQQKLGFIWQNTEPVLRRPNGSQFYSMFTEDGFKPQWIWRRALGAFVDNGNIYVFCLSF